MAAKFLADPNEDQEAADFFVAKFRKDGVRLGAPLNLVVRVNKIPIARLSTVESQVRSLYDCSRVERAEIGLLVKKARLTAYLHPIVFERDSLLKAARAMYRIILDNDVHVEIVARQGFASDVPPIWSKERLKRGIQILCITYCSVFWVLPVAVLVIFGELPYLHERGFLDRLPFSVGGTLALVAAMAVFFPERFRVYRASTSLKTVKNWLLAMLGLMMFTASAAAWCGNVFGAIVKLTPASEYSATFIVLGLEAHGSRLRSVSLSLKPVEGTRESYLTLSARLFDYRAIHMGDRLVLRGKRNVVGIYVDHLDLLRADSLPPPNSGRLWTPNGTWAVGTNRYHT